MTGAPPDLDAEWLEADGLGGFASGTVGGTRTRRYHALLLTATRPPAAHLGVAGRGHVSEVADGDPPHAPGGCPFQAWSLGELLRAERMVAP